MSRIEPESLVVGFLNFHEPLVTRPLLANGTCFGSLVLRQMLAAKAQNNLADAKRYFKEHLSVGDYYTEGQHVPGQWFGKGAEDLGLSGVTNTDEFVRLCENLHPQTGEQLTLRNKTTRTELIPTAWNIRRQIAACFTISLSRRQNPFPLLHSLAMTSVLPTRTSKQLRWRWINCNPSLQSRRSSFFSVLTNN
jgi:hypothetical protein